MQNNQTTISLKIPQDLVTNIKKASRIRGISMSDLIRQNLQNTYSTNAKKEQEPAIFEYFGLFKEDDQILEFENSIQEQRKLYAKKDIDF